MEITLRKLDPWNLPKEYITLINDKAVLRYLDAEGGTWAQLEDYVLDKNCECDSHLFGIYLDEEFIGTTKLEDGDIGIAIARHRWGLGICKEVVRRMKSYALDVLGLDHVTAGFRSGNTGSKRCFESNGFVVVETRMEIKNDKKARN